MGKNDSVCDRSHLTDVSKETLAALPRSQRGPGRHACAVCAYLAGYAQALRDLEAKKKEGK